MQNRKKEEAQLRKKFVNYFPPASEYTYFSIPGRIEFCGNHTDHQGGNVLAAGIELDTIAIATLRNSGTIRVFSEGFGVFQIDYQDLEQKNHEVGTTYAIIRGICREIEEKGYSLGGFDAYVASYIPYGYGLSSSASFEILIGSILNHFFCHDALSNLEIAKIGQKAESFYFGKPCGLLDQIACATGGMLTINFQNKEYPKIEKFDYDFAKSGHAICLIQTEGDHTNLTEEYASIPMEMNLVAHYFGKERLCDVSKEIFYAAYPDVRKKAGDRAVLRATHFFEETERVLRAQRALKQNDFATFCKEISASGRSSFMFLQNIYCADQIQHQSLTIALSCCERFLEGRGAFRVHGGGFAGTVLALIPQDILPSFIEEMDTVMGKNACRVLHVQQEGIWIEDTE